MEMQSLLNYDSSDNLLALVEEQEVDIDKWKSENTSLSLYDAINLCSENYSAIGEKLYLLTRKQIDLQDTSCFFVVMVFLSVRSIMNKVKVLTESKCNDLLDIIEKQLGMLYRCNSFQNIDEIRRNVLNLQSMIMGMKLNLIHEQSAEAFFETTVSRKRKVSSTNEMNSYHISTQAIAMASMCYESCVEALQQWKPDSMGWCYVRNFFQTEALQGFPYTKVNGMRKP